MFTLKQIFYASFVFCDDFVWNHNSTTIQKSLVIQFEGLLKEESVYDFSIFFVTDSLAFLKLVDHNFKLNFHKNTYAKAMTYGFFRDVNSFSFAKFVDIILDHDGQECAIGKQVFVSKTMLVYTFVMCLYVFEFLNYLVFCSMDVICLFIGYTNLMLNMKVGRCTMRVSFESQDLD